MTSHGGSHLLRSFFEAPAAPVFNCPVVGLRMEFIHMLTQYPLDVVLTPLVTGPVGFETSHERPNPGV